jgi:hypothetical protein
MQCSLCGLELVSERDDTNELLKNLQASHPVENLAHIDQHKNQQEDAIPPTTEPGTSKPSSEIYERSKKSDAM